MSKSFMLLLTASTLCLSTFAQIDTMATRQLNEVVVTANKMPMKAAETGKIITVIDHKTIENNAGSSLATLLNTQAGFFINGSNNALGTNLDLYFRGSTAGNMLIVIDGVPVYDPSQINNSFELNSIPLDQVERIEILKGGQSTLWGSNAVAGVIQIFLKKESKKKIAINANAAYGTYNTLNGGAGISGSIKKWDYLVQYNYINSGGFPAAYDSTGKQNFKNDGFKQNTVIAETRYHFSPHLTAKAFGNFSNYFTDLPAGAFTDEKDYTLRSINNLGGASLNYQHNKVDWTLQGSYQQSNRHYVNDSTYVSSPYFNYSNEQYTGHTTTLETFGNVQLHQHLRLVAGLQYQHQNTGQSYFSTGPYGPYSSELGQDSAHVSQISAYASLLLLNLHGFNFELGSRINHHSIYGNNATYTINPSFIIDENTKLFINISSGYNIPSLYQLYSAYGNKNLKPESSVTYEMGLQTQSTDKKMSLRLAAFKRDTKNLIIFYTDANYNSYYINRDAQHDYGFEVESNTQVGRFGTWTNNLTYIDGHGIQNGVSVNNLFRRPNFTMNSILTLSPFKGFTLAPAFKYVGTRLKGPYDVGPDLMPAYYTLNCFISYQINQRIRLFTSLNNITNQQYFDIVGYNSKRFNMMSGAYFNF